MATEKRLIDAKDFDLRVSQRSMTEVFPNWKELPVEVQDAVCKHGQYLHLLLETQPTVDAVEVVHGRWISQYSSLGNCFYYHCSECGESEPRQGTMRKQAPYCPNCGAKMDGGGVGGGGTAV